MYTFFTDMVAWRYRNKENNTSRTRNINQIKNKPVGLLNIKDCMSFKEICRELKKNLVTIVPLSQIIAKNSPEEFRTQKYTNIAEIV